MRLAAVAWVVAVARALNPIDRWRAARALPRATQWCDAATAVEAAPAAWRWRADGAASPLAFSALDATAAGRLAESLGAASRVVHGAPVVESAAARPAARAARVPDAATTRRRTEAFVDRALVGLGLCPFTGSRSLAAVGLADAGVRAAPILYARSDGADATAVVADVWAAIDAMRAGGPDRWSSILLAAPAYDRRANEWVADVFPALEAAVVAARASRTFGLVCFHPGYETPDDAWLATHRFGHMYAPARLRAWASEAGADDVAAWDDADLAYFGAAQRRTPHATVNVLWAAQLEAAEAVRASRDLYVRNLRRLHAQGRPALEAAAARERTLT